jgi:hypothetical protein
MIKNQERKGKASSKNQRTGQGKLGEDEARKGLNNPGKVRKG